MRRLALRVLVVLVLVLVPLCANSVHADSRSRRTDAVQFNAQGNAASVAAAAFEASRVADGGTSGRGGSSRSGPPAPDPLGDYKSLRALAQESWQAYVAGLPECQGPLAVTNPVCQFPETGVPLAAAPSRESVAAIARQAALSMTLPDPDIKVGPEPERNEWDMAVVGYPLWLWTTTPSTMSSSLSESGITLTLDASRRGVVYDMGDGKQVECTTSTPWTPAVKPAAPSPDCGYTYAWPSLPKGSYTVKALSVWDVQWSALGYSGTVEVRTSASRQLPVGELQAVVLADDNG